MLQSQLLEGEGPGCGRTVPCQPLATGCVRSMGTATLLACRMPVQGGRGPEKPSGGGRHGQQWDGGGTPRVSVRGPQALPAAALASAREAPRSVPPGPASRRGWRGPSRGFICPTGRGSSTWLWPAACARAGAEAGKRCELLTGVPAHRARPPRPGLSITAGSTRFRSPPLSSTGVSSGNSATVFCRVVQIVLYLLSCQVQCHKQ